MKTKDSELTYKERNEKRRNEAEEVAEIFFDKKNITYRRLGFDEKSDPIESNKFSLVPSVIRCLPDYIAIGNKAIFVEAKGFVDDLKIKEDDFEEYKKWNTIMPLSIFAYDTKKKVIFYFELDQIIDSLHLFAKDKYHDNQKTYFRIDWEFMKQNFKTL
jgi:hypothetical protein